MSSPSRSRISLAVQVTTVAAAVTALVISVAAHHSVQRAWALLDPPQVGPQWMWQDYPNGQPANVVAGDPGGATGVRDNPLPPGVTFQLADWRLTLGQTNQDARDQLLAHDPWNRDHLEQSEAQRMRPVLVPVQLTYTGAGSGHAYELEFTFVAGDGNTHFSSNSCGLVPDALGQVGEMFTGAEGRGNVCVAAPADQITGGMWMIQSPMLDAQRARIAGTSRLRVFVALATDGG